MPEQMDFTRDDPPEKPKRSRKKAAPPAEAGAEAARPRPTADANAGGTDRADPGTKSGAERADPGVKPAAERADPVTKPGAARPEGADASAFGDISHLTKKGLRIVPVVTGAVVDPAGNFLFYVDGHEDARSGVQAQINHLLGSGPAREEHLAPARARARELVEKLTQPRGSRTT